MPVHISELASDVAVFEGDLPLGGKQMEKVADYVLKRRAGEERDERLRRDAVCLRTASGRPAPFHRR